MTITGMTRMAMDSSLWMRSDSSKSHCGIARIGHRHLKFGMDLIYLGVMASRARDIGRHSL